MSRQGLHPALIAVVALCCFAAGTVFVVYVATSGHSQPRAHTNIASAVLDSTSVQTTTAKESPKRQPAAEQKLAAALNDHCKDKWARGDLLFKPDYIGHLFDPFVTSDEKGNQLSFKNVKVAKDSNTWVVEVDANAVCKEARFVQRIIQEHYDLCDDNCIGDDQSKSLLVFRIVGRTLKEEFKADPKAIRLVIHLGIDVQCTTTDEFGKSSGSHVINTVTGVVNAPEAAKIAWDNVDFVDWGKIANASYIRRARPPVL